MSLSFGRHIYQLTMLAREREAGRERELARGSRQEKDLRGQPSDNAASGNELARSAAAMRATRRAAPRMWRSCPPLSCPSSAVNRPFPRAGTCDILEHWAPRFKFGGFVVPKLGQVATNMGSKRGINFERRFDRQGGGCLQREF